MSARHHARVSLAQVGRTCRSRPVFTLYALGFGWICADTIGTLLVGPGTGGIASGLRSATREAWWGIAAPLWILGTGSVLLAFLSPRWGLQDQRAALPVLPIAPLHRALAEVLPWLGLVMLASLVPHGVALVLDAPRRTPHSVLVATLLTGWTLGGWMVVERWNTLVQRPRIVYRSTLLAGAVLVGAVGAGVQALPLLMLWPLVLGGAVATALRRGGPLGGARALGGAPTVQTRPSRPGRVWRDAWGPQGWLPLGHHSVWTALALALAVVAAAWIGWLATGGNARVWWMLLAVPWMACWVRPLGFHGVDLRRMLRESALLPVRPGHLITSATLQRIQLGALMVVATAVVTPLLAPADDVLMLPVTLGAQAMLVGSLSAMAGLAAARGPAWGLALGAAGLASGVWLILGTELLPRQGVWTLPTLLCLVVLLTGPGLVALPGMLRPRPVEL